MPPEVQHNLLVNQGNKEDLQVGTINVNMSFSEDDNKKIWLYIDKEREIRGLLHLGGGIVCAP